MKLGLLISAGLVAFPCNVLAGWASTQRWNISAEQNNSVFVFTVLFGLSVWFLARALWTRDIHTKWFNLGLFLIVFIPGLWLIFPH